MELLVNVGVKFSFDDDWFLAVEGGTLFYMIGGEIVQSGELCGFLLARGKFLAIYRGHC